MLIKLIKKSEIPPNPPKGIEEPRWSRLARRIPLLNSDEAFKISGLKNMYLAVKAIYRATKYEGISINSYIRGKHLYLSFVKQVQVIKPRRLWKCDWCGDDYFPKGREKTCSKECWRENSRQIKRNWKLRQIREN